MGQGEGWIDMEHDWEEFSIGIGEGKKRLCKEGGTQSFNRVEDALVVREERPVGRAYFVSAAAKRQVDRSQ